MSLEKLRDRINQLAEFQVPKYTDNILNEQAPNVHSGFGFAEEPKEDKEETDQTLDKGDDVPFRLARIGESKIRVQDSKTGDKIDIPENIIESFCSKLNEFKQPKEIK
jgi:hypothetical protein